MVETGTTQQALRPYDRTIHAMPVFRHHVRRQCIQEQRYVGRVLGQRRVVIAFDPDNDDTEVLRTVTLLLRTVAIAASVRTGDAEIDTAEEKIGEAVTQLDKIDTIKKTAGSIQKGAAKIESECTSITTAIRRLLDQALVALAGHEAGPGLTERPSSEDAA